MTLPWSSTDATAAKSVVMPNSALNRSAWMPVFAAPVSAAAFAFAQSVFAAAFALQLLTSSSHTNCVMMSMFCAEPCGYDVSSAGSKDVSLRLSKPVAKMIFGIEHEPKSASPTVFPDDEAAAVVEAATEAVTADEAAVVSAAAAVTVTVTGA